MRNDISVTGILNPILWDKKGNPKQFSIYSDEEEDIIIEGYMNRSKLTQLLGKRVLAKGKIRIDDSGDKFIYLRSIKELTDPSSPAVNLISSLRFSDWNNEEYSVSIPREYALAKYNQVSDFFWEAA